MNVADLAEDSVGKIKYSFGASSIGKDGKGTADCSSFTQWLFEKMGLNIGRTTEQQYMQGSSIEKKDLKKGDLVFFKNTYNSGYKDGVSHVGVYIGNNQFVHNSSGKGGTTVSSLDSAYYKSHYLGAKRIKGASDAEAPNSKEPTKKEPAKKEEDIDLKWWGDLLVTLLTVILVGVALVFFISAFNGKNAEQNTKNISHKIKKKKVKK